MGRNLLRLGSRVAAVIHKAIEVFFQDTKSKTEDFHLPTRYKYVLGESTSRVQGATSGKVTPSYDRRRLFIKGERVCRIFVDSGLQFTHPSSSCMTYVMTALRRNQSR